MSVEEITPQIEEKKFEFFPVFMKVSLMAFALASILIFQNSLSKKKPSRPNVTIPASR